VKHVARIPKMTEGEEGLDRGRLIPAC